MRVFTSTIGKVKDGQLEAAVGVAAEAAKLVGRHGGDVRFFVAGAGAEIKYESPEALGRAFDALNGDAELQAFAMRVNAANSPTVLTAQTMGMELPLGRTPKAGKGSILEVHSSRVNPGRMEEAKERLRNAIERAGAFMSGTILTLFGLHP